MKPRPPQLTLWRDAVAPTADAQWCAGIKVPYLGAMLTLMLDTACREPARIDAQLHLPLPPAATPRQIRDAAESWLREEALRIFSTLVAQKSAQAGRHPADTPRLALVFGRRSDWVRCEGGLLRCHWRLVEQPLVVIEQVLGRALAAMQSAPSCNDFFALA